MGTDNIEKLYKNYEILAEAKDKINEHEKEYVEILEAVKGTEKEKRLASQFIGKFFKHFPNLAHQAIEAHLDLCEDDDISIRKQAIKDLPSLCKDSKEHTQRIADILAQLLQAYDTTELNTVHNSILTLLKTDPKGALSGLFSQIHQGTDNELVRERCIKFLSAKVRQLGKDYINKEAEDYIIAECKKVLEDVNAEEFDQIMELIGWTKLGRTVVGHREIVDLVAAQVLTEGEFSVNESEHIDRLVQCVGHALPYFSTQVNSTRFVNFFCEHVIPKMDQIGESEEGSDPKLEILKLLAELSVNCGSLEKAEERVETIYNCLIKFMPLPPTTVGEETEETTPILEFSHVECLLFTFHRLARQSPNFLTSDQNRLKEFRLRLQYFARLTQGYIKKLKEATNGKTNEELKTDENKIKVVALRTTSNINTLIKDLFHTPPSYKNTIQLSFQTRSNKIASDDNAVSKTNTTEVVGEKRHKPITFEKDDADKPQLEKRSRTDKGANQKVYTPPSGKYSNRLNVSSNNTSFGGGNWRRGRNGRNFNRNNSRNGAPFRRNYY